jgi:phage tail sheath protein FI
MIIEVATRVSSVGLGFVFEQNTSATRARFVSQLTPILSLVQSQSGIDSFTITMNESNNTQRDIDQNKLNGRIVIVPTRSVEFIAIDFIVANSGVQFV